MAHLAALLVISGCGGGTGESPRSATEPANATTKSLEPQPPEGYGFVYRFAKISNGAYFFTGNIAERDQIIASYPDFRYEGIAFLQTTGGPSTPVYRFANLGNGGYFYTASAEERDLVIQTRRDMRYEGSTYAVAQSLTVGASPVYRLANTANGAYLYTVDPTERDYATALGIWRNEGVAFLAMTFQRSGSAGEPPAYLGTPASLIPVASSVFLGSDPEPFYGRFGGSSIRDRMVLDPDGRTSQLGEGAPRSGRWSLSGEDIVITYDADGATRRYSASWKTPSRRSLVARPAVDAAYFAANWGTIDDGASRDCPDRSRPASAPIRQGPLELRADGSYRSGLRMIALCNGVSTMLDAVGLVERLKSGRWEISPARGRITFIEESGERFDARIDGVSRNSGDYASLCIAGTSLRTPDATQSRRSLIASTTSVSPVRSNLPLALAEGDACTVTSAGGSTLVELNSDGSAQALWPDAEDAQIARWRVDDNLLTLMRSDGSTVAVLDRGFRWTEVERRVMSRNELIGRWLERSFASFGSRPGSPAGSRGTNDVEFNPDGRYQFAPPPAGSASDRFSVLGSGRWSFDAALGKISFAPDNGTPVDFRVSYETPMPRIGDILPESELLRYSGPRLQIDSRQFTRP